MYFSADDAQFFQQWKSSKTGRSSSHKLVRGRSVVESSAAKHRTVGWQYREELVATCTRNISLCAAWREDVWVEHLSFCAFHWSARKSFGRSALWSLSIFTSFGAWLSRDPRQMLTVTKYDQQCIDLVTIRHRLHLKSMWSSWSARTRTAPSAVSAWLCHPTTTIPTGFGDLSWAEQDFNGSS